MARRTKRRACRPFGFVTCQRGYIQSAHHVQCDYPGIQKRRRLIEHREGAQCIFARVGNAYSVIRPAHTPTLGIRRITRSRRAPNAYRSATLFACMLLRSFNHVACCISNRRQPIFCLGVESIRRPTCGAQPRLRILGMMISR